MFLARLTTRLQGRNELSNSGDGLGVQKLMKPYTFVVSYTIRGFFRAHRHLSAECLRTLRKTLRCNTQFAEQRRSKLSVNHLLYDSAGSHFFAFFAGV